MILRKIISDIMIPIDNYATISPEKRLKDAVLKLRQIYCEVESGKCTEAGFRTCFVVEGGDRLVGVLDFQSILETLIPEITGGFGEKLTFLGMSVAYAEANASDLDVATSNLIKRVKMYGDKVVGDFMKKIKAEGIQATDNLIDGLKLMHKRQTSVIPVYDGVKLVGVLRDSDLFLVVADILGQND